MFWLLKSFLVSSILILAAEAAKLSLIKGSFFQQAARENKMVEMILPASRGEIVDRKGRSVAKSIYRYYRQQNGENEFSGEGEYQADKIEGEGQSLELKRQYPLAKSMAHISGYVGMANQEELQKEICGGKLNNESLIGRSGIEKSGDCQLRGKDGRRLIEVDALGNYIRELGRIDPEVGRTINLSTDAYWQDKIYRMVETKKAVVIISEPKTGKIVTLVSTPAFDPGLFSYQQDNEAVKSYLTNNIDYPMLNRAIAASYHNGSTFKIVVAAAGLESGVINQGSVYEDSGIIKIGDYSYSNWLWSQKGITEGRVNVVRGLQRSNDIFFYKLSGDVGVERIKIWAVNFGYGQKTGVELPGELAGVVPDDKWKRENRQERWFLGDTYHLAIGQGFLAVTPIQVNQMTNIVANDGIKCQLSILKDTAKKCQNIGIKKSTIDLIKTGMIRACQPGGTAYPLYNFKTAIACKTGTAEVGEEEGTTHAWLTAYAPADDPQISVTVMVEKGGEGSDTAAPIVGDILKEWFNEPNTVVPRKIGVSLGG